MSNDNLKNIYNALVTPSPQTNNKPLFTKDEIGATPEEFAKIMSNSENAKNIYTALTSPIASLGNKPIFTSAEIGDNADAFSSILGIQKKSPIGSVSTSGSEPFQDKMLGGGVKINPFQPVSTKPVEKQIVEKRTDKQLAKEVMKAETVKGITSIPRFLYDAASLLARKTVQGQFPTVYPDYDQLRAMSRTEGAFNVLDVLDDISKTAKAESDALASKISTNKYGYIETMKSGEWGKVLDKTVNDLIISAPAMAMIAVNPMAATTVFASAKNLDLVDNDSIPDDLKPVNAFFTGVAEVILEGKIGGTAIIKNTILNAIKEGGKEAGIEVTKKTIQKMFTDYVKKVSPEVAKEIGLAGGEEAITNISQQLTSYLTGESDKIDLNQTLDAFAGGVTGGAALKGAGKTVGVASKTVKQAMQGLNTKSKAIASDLDNPAVSPEVKKQLVTEYINTNKEIADKEEKIQTTVEKLTPMQQKSLDAIAADMGNMEALLEDPNLSQETKATFQAKLDELQAKADAITSKGESIEYVSEGDNFFKILLDGTKEPISEQEFDQAIETVKPINEKNGEIVTVNIGGKAITGTVEVDEGGKATIYSGGTIYELPNNTQYVDYASPVRISDIDGSIEFDGISYPEVRIETIDGKESAVLIDEAGKPKTVKDPAIVEEFKYQITLANLQELTEPEAITLLSEYENSKGETDAATEEGANQANEQTEQDIKLQEAIDEINLIELIALEELENAESEAKLVSYKPVNSKEEKVYLVKKNADGTISATLNGRNVKRPDVLKSIASAYEIQSKEQSKKLVAKLQDQTNKLKAEVEERLFGKKAETVSTPVEPVSAPVTEQAASDFNSYGLTNKEKKLAEAYKSRLSKLKSEDPDQYWSVDLPSDDIIANAVKNDRLVDVAGGMGIVTTDGNMIGMFKYDQTQKGTSKLVQAERVKKGGIKLDNFDNYLTNLYQKNGFRVVARVPFNEEYAPEGWNKEKHGLPDVVMMVYDPNNKLNIKEKRFIDPETGYEEGLNYRDSFVEQAKINLQTQEQNVAQESSQQEVGVNEVASKLEEVTKGKDPSKSSSIGQRIITALIESGLAFHGGESKITLFDANKIKGGVRANLGKGFYFGASFKPFDYGGKLTYIDLSKFNLINGDLDNEFAKPFIDKLNNFIKENSENLSNSVIRQVMFANRLVEELKKPNKAIDLAIRNTKDSFQFDSSDISNDIMKAIGYDGMQVTDNYEISIFDNAIDKLNNSIVSDQNKFLADAYAKAKQDGSNPKLVEVVDEILKTQEQNATQESSQQVIQGGEQGDQLQRERTDEGQQKAGERKGGTRKAEKPKADSGNRPVSSRKKEVADQPKVEAPKPVGLTANETKYKENPDALSKDELKDVLDSKRERLKKANAALEKGELSPEETKVKQKAIDNLENTIEDLVKRIDAGISKKIATKEDAIGSEEIPVKNQTRIKKSLDGLKNEFSSDKLKMKVIEAVEKGISVLQSAFPSMNIVIHKSSSDFLEATGLPMVNGKVPAGVFMFSGDTKVGYEGTIHINLTNANPTVVYHEIAHALMLKVLGENKAMFDSFKNKVSKILSEKTAANLNEFIAPYSEFEKSEEYIVQLVAALTATKSNTNPSVLMKLKVAINELISKITGGKITVFAEEAEGIEVYNFLKQMAETIKEGKDISTLQESFNGDLFEPTELDITGITPDDIPASKRYPRAKEFRGDYEMVDHPIITNKILKGKPIAVTMSDHTKVGVYRNDKSGVEYSGLMGGVFYPYIKGIRDAGLGWASVTTKAARALVANAVNTDYTVVYRMSRATGSLGNVNFGDIAFLELTAPVTNKKVSEKIFLSELNSQLSKVKSGVSFLDKYGVNGKVNSIASLKKGLDKMSFSTRGEFWKVVMKGSWSKKSTGSWYQFLEKYNVASLEDIVNGLAEMEVDTALDHDVVAVLKIAKPEYTSDGIIKIYTTRKELVNEKKGVFFIDAPDHPSYPYVVKGEPIGVLNEFNNISEYFPVIKTWIESKRLNSPYKAVETMGKELISSRISELENQLKTTKDFIKKYKDDLFSEKLGVAKTPEQMIQAMKEDVKFFRAIVDFAYLSIKLKGLKTIEAFKAELEKQLGVKFDKLPQELKDAWAQAKVMVATEKKQAPTVKQTIKESTEQGTSKEKIATFAEYMAAKYKGMAEGEKIGQANRFKLIEAAVQYVRKAAIEDMSKAKIISLVNKAIKVNSYDNVKAFGKFVDKLLENHKYYAKVAELESLLPKLGKKLRNEKLGSIAPQVRRLMIINPENLTEADIDLFIKLTKELLSGNVTNLNSGLEALKASEKTYLENKFIAGLMSDEELMYATNSLEDLQAESNNPTLSAMDQRKKSAEYREEVEKKLAMFAKQRELIMEYIRGDRTIKSAKEYISLVNAVKKQNYALNRLMQNNIISDVQKEQLSIDPTGEELSLIEEALKEKLGDFRKSLSDQIGNVIASLRNQVATGGIRAKLFDNLTDFDKKAYDQTLTDVLTVPLEVLQDLDIVELDAFFNAVEQLNNGYFSPKLLESLEIIESKGFANSIRDNADGYYKDQVDAEGKYDAKVSPLLKQVKDFKGISALVEFMKTLDYKEMESFFSDGFVKMFGQYIYKPFEKAYTFYKNTLEETTEDVVLADDNIKSNTGGQVIRNVIGIFLIQADHLRNENYKNWSDDKKNLPQYLIDQNDAGRLDAAQDDMNMLKKAMAEIEGDISTKAGLDAAMNKYFAKNPKSKNLYEAIRKSIDEKVAPMNKISIEREGGYFEPDGDYFPIQRKGAKVQESENPYEDMMDKKYEKNFKLRNNATYRRVGDPFVMREFNATIAFNILAEDATRTYALKPVINPYMRAITDLANEYDLKGKRELSNFLNASKEYMNASIALQFQRDINLGFFKYVSRFAAFQRGYLLAQGFRLFPDYLANMTKALSTMNPIDLAKYLYKQSDFSKLSKKPTSGFSSDAFVNLAKAVSSPIIFKTSGVKVENQFMNKRVREKKLDKLAGMADVFSASSVWKGLVMKNFKEITGKDLDTKQLENNISEYYLENQKALDRAAYLADLEIDKRYVTQSEIGRAPSQQIFPAVGGTAALNRLTVKRTSKGLSILNMMASYIANDAKVFGAASRRLITQGDVSGFVKDVLPILTSQLVYATTMSYMNAVASTLGYAVLSAGGDEEDETVLEYFADEMEQASKFYTDPNAFAKGYLASLLMMATGRYATISRAAAAVGMGFYASFDINKQQDKKAKTETIKKWKDTFSVTKGQFYFEPIMFSKDKRVESSASDLALLTPLVGFFWKQAEFQFNPDNPTAIMAAVKELGKEDPDVKNVITGTMGLTLLFGVSLGLTYTPTILKTASEAAKTKGRRDAEEKKKSKGMGKRDDGFGGFGSDGFSSSKF